MPAVAAAAVVVLSGAAWLVAGRGGAARPPGGNGSVFDFTVLDARRQPFPLAQFRGRALLIINVASQCGLTNGGYKAASSLFTKYKDRGLVVLGFPCSQFANQEPGTDDEIQHLVCTKFHAEFPVLAKVDVNGGNAAPLWQWLKREMPGVLGTEFIKWNFTAFLCGPDGKVVARYSPGVPEAAIERDLGPLLRSAAAPSK